MNPLNFLQHLFTHRAIEHELADEKIMSKALKAENEKLHAQLETDVQARDTEIIKLRQEIKELKEMLHAGPPIAETNFDVFKM